MNFLCDRKFFVIWLWFPVVPPGTLLFLGDPQPLRRAAHHSLVGPQAVIIRHFLPAAVTRVEAQV